MHVTMSTRHKYTILTSRWNTGVRPEEISQSRELVLMLRFWKYDSRRGEIRNFPGRLRKTLNAMFKTETLCAHGANRDMGSRLSARRVASTVY
jgi:hypothetical protein